VEEEWIKTLADGRRVKFTSQELLETQAFVTAQVESNKAAGVAGPLSQSC